MSLFNALDIAGTGMGAQTVRLNVTASNLANAESASGTEQGAYRAREPVFSAIMDEMQGETAGAAVGGVRVLGVVENTAEAQRRYSPEHPLADTQGYIYLPNVNPIEQMANMISASRAYQSNVEIFNTSKQLLLMTLRMGS